MPILNLPIEARLGGQVRKFALLSVEDLVRLTAQVGGEAALIDVATLYRWAGNPAGCSAVLLAAVQHYEDKRTLAEVEGWGSIMQRVALARTIMDRSLVNGEEDTNDTPNPPNGEGPDRNATGGPSAVSSPTGVPA